MTIKQSRMTLEQKQRRRAQRRNPLCPDCHRLICLCSIYGKGGPESSQAPASRVSRRPWWQMGPWFT